MDRTLIVDKWYFHTCSLSFSHFLCVWEVCLTMYKELWSVPHVCLIWKEACRKEEKKASDENFKHVNEWVHLTRMLNGLWVNFDNTAARIVISDKSFNRLPENKKSLCFRNPLKHVYVVANLSKKKAKPFRYRNRIVHLRERDIEERECY